MAYRPEKQAATNITSNSARAMSVPGLTKLGLMASHEELLLTEKTFGVALRFEETLLNP
ncbi:hypothetical protein M758_12G009900 [Ceratodon purpureus]|nr:hypothetical protein M758_12G009900 [Ceratodon purpureus]